MTKKSTSIQLDPSDIARCTREAHERSLKENRLITRSDIIREGIECYFTSRACEQSNAPQTEGQPHDN